MNLLAIGLNGYGPRKEERSGEAGKETYLGGRGGWQQGQGGRDRRREGGREGKEGMVREAATEGGREEEKEGGRKRKG